MGHDVAKELKIYKAIYFGLIALSVITVLASYIPASVALGIVIALIIASFKASLVAGFFMHLREEKPVILWLVGFTLFFFIAMIGLIWIGQYNLYEGAYYVTEQVSHDIH